MVKTLFILLVIFNILDIYQTKMLLDLGVSEWNPIINYVGDRFGFLRGVIMLKSVFISLLGFAIYLKFRASGDSI
ncbi:MAG: DUF5658 family protein [Desulfobacterales bacterium]